MLDHLKVIELIQNHFPTAKFEPHQIIEGDEEIKIEGYEFDKLVQPNLLFKHLENSHFRKVSTGSILFHYLDSKYLENTLNGKIRFYNLLKYIHSDEREYQYFLERFSVLLPNAEKQIQESKENTFILSCTATSNNLKLWERFGKDAACIEFEFRFNEELSNTIESRFVEYEAALTKLFCLQECLLEQFNKRIDIDNWHVFAKFFKRSFYNFENEIRLCLDNSMKHIKNVMLESITKGEIKTCDEDHLFNIETDAEGNNYIEVDAQNPFFTLEIKSIQFASKPSSEIESKCRSHNIEFALK